MPQSFIHPDFLLESSSARRLFHEFAEHQPIIDYHNHLPPAAIAQDRKFKDITSVWLDGDHYKWRAMRANGIDERLITGDASPRERFDAWARTVPVTLRNPLHHWTHLELARYFDVFEPLDETTAGTVWDRANACLAQEDFSVRGLLRRMKVEVVCTTDDPVESLEHHEAMRECPDLKMLPTFRPDAGLNAGNPGVWNTWVDQLAARTGRTVGTYDEFLTALRQRHDDFHAVGGRVSDHGHSCCPAAFASPDELGAIFQRVRGGGAVSDVEAEQFATGVLMEIGRWNHAKGWTMQLHLGALRNTNTRLLARLGADAGVDSVGDWPQAARLAAFLDRLNRDGCLPRVILYNLNPADNYVFATMIGNFNDGSIAGKIQFGSGWWFLDQREAMEWQINALSNLGLLSRFIGMLTDSRSFLSFPRHEYFRRVLCNLIGNDIERGLIPADWKLLEHMITGICHRNAQEYFRF